MAGVVDSDMTSDEEVEVTLDDTEVECFGPFCGAEEPHVEVDKARKGRCLLVLLLCLRCLLGLVVFSAALLIRLPDRYVAFVTVHILVDLSAGVLARAVICLMPISPPRPAPSVRWLFLPAGTPLQASG